MTGVIFDIKEFTVHDGGGIRTTVFLKGCPLRCVWCHNPEGQRIIRELLVNQNGCTNCGECKKPCLHSDCREFGRCLYICPHNLVRAVGERIESGELAAKLLRQKDLYDAAGGGVTLSGGEPLYQPDFTAELLGRLRESGINTAIETCGYAAAGDFLKVISCCDMVFFDLKLADRDAHIKYTGVPNDLIIANLKILKESGIPHVLRTPLIPGITDTPENLSGIKRLAGSSEQELLPYNKLAGAKYKGLGRVYTLASGQEKIHEDK